VSPIITNQPIASKVCENTNATFTVVANTAATGYQWQVKNGTDWVNINGQTTATLTLNNVTNSINNNQYHCTILETTGKCPINSQDVTLTVDLTPVSSAGGSKTICSTGTATVSGATASSGTTYSWTENGNGSITAGGNTLTPTYTPTTLDVGTPVILTMATVSGNSCPNPVDVTYTINVDALPTAVSTGTTTICSNDKATVSGATASSGTTYSWTENGNGSITAGENTLTPTYTPTTSDVGTPVILTMATVSGNSCPNPGDVTYTINVDALPTAVSIGTTTICSNATATVSGASHTNGNVLWTLNGTGNGTITNQTTDSPTYTPIATDAGKTVTLSMHVTSTNTCPDPTDVTFKITIDSLPLAKVTGTKTICSSNTATITNAKSAYGDIAWTSDGTGTITNGATLSPTYTPTVNDEGKTVTITLTVTSNNSCSNTTKATANYLLNVIGAIIPTASTNNGNSTICMDKQVTVSGATSSNGTVSWAVTTGSGLLTNETTLTPTYISKANDTITPVKLTMTVNPPIGCGGTPVTDIYTINVKSNPIVQPFCNKPCEGNDVQLNANSILNAQYTWSGPKGFTSTTQNVLISKITASDTGQYNLQITDVNNCINSKSIRVSMYSNPVIIGDTFVCVGKTTQLNASTSGNSTSWSSLNSSSLNIDPTSGKASGILGGVVTIKYTDINGCIDNQLILVEDLPVVSFTVDSTSVCIGNDVKFSDKSINKNTTLVWDFGDGNQSNELEPSYTYQKVDSFTVSLTSISPNGCIGKLTKNKYITPIDVPTVKFGFSPDSIDIYNPEIQLINYSTAKFYTWIFGDYSPISNQVNPNHTFPDTPGQSYKVILKGSNSLSGVCPVSTSHIIASIDPAIYFIPNSFTPNGDEINNTFQPVFTSGYDPQNFSFWIYNRIGELVFESHNALIGWDGTYAGKMAENNTYIWKLQFKSKQTEKEYYMTGHVNLVK
jgi:gliding motility-associated-like protein